MPGLVNGSLFQPTAAVPEINDLVTVTIGTLADRGEHSVCRDAASRIEDVILDSDTGEPAEYLVAAPSFAGDLDVPYGEVPIVLQWLSPRGVCRMPAVFVAQERTRYGLRMWRLSVTGPAVREERRRFVRVTWSIPAELRIRRDLDQVDPDQRRMLASQTDLRSALAGLPDVIEAQTVNLSEGGLLCAYAGPILPAHLPVVAKFRLDTTDFEVDSFVVRSNRSGHTGPDRHRVETALVFDGPGKHAEVLRPLVFEAQLRDRRLALR